MGRWQKLPFDIMVKNAHAELKVDDRYVYNVDYTIDKFARRVTPEQSTKKSSQAILLFGCSFAFGEGLSDNQTLAYYLSKQNKSTDVYNYGIPGASPGEILLRMRHLDAHKEIQENIGTTIYLFMDSHIARIAGKMSVIGSWGNDKLHFYLDNAGKVQQNGSYFEAQPWKTKLFHLLSKSNFLKYFQIDLPWWNEKSDFALMAQIINEMKDESVRIGSKKFYVVFHPDSKVFAPILIPYLKAKGIKYIDFSSLDVDQLTFGNARISFDGHPSSDSNKLLAKKLNADLEFSSK